MLSVPDFVPAVPGLKVTEIVQFAPASSVVPQVLVSVKSPLVVMLETGTEASVGLVRVTVWALLVVPTACAEKKSEEEDNLARGVMEVVEVPGDELVAAAGGTIGRRGPAVMGEPEPLEAPLCPGSGVLGGCIGMGGSGPEVMTSPMPLRVTVCGLPKALSKRESAPLRVPGPWGVKVTAIEQFEPLARVAPQVFVSRKSPPVVMLRIVNAALPGLPSMTVWGLLAVPTT
jgi:hypothetical protein